MNSPVRPPLATIVPENAPFTAEQRVWLNGFFAGLLEGDATALSPQDAAGADAGRRDRRPRPTATMARRGTTRPCRSPSA